MQGELVRYLICGIATTGVNVGAFAALRAMTNWNMQVANAISIFIAILFAYIVNRTIVFRSKHVEWREVGKEFLSFVGMRGISMGVEMIGMEIFTVSMNVPELIAKMGIQFVVIVSNYLISKCYVFKKREE